MVDWREGFRHGILSRKKRTKSLAQYRALLGVPERAEGSGPKTWEEVLLEITGTDVRQCPKCIQDTCGWIADSSRYTMQDHDDNQLTSIVYANGATNNHVLSPNGATLHWVQGMTEPSLPLLRLVEHQQWEPHSYSTARASDSIPLGRKCSARLAGCGGQAASSNRDFIRD